MKDEKTAAYFCTGVHATPEEIKTLKEAHALPVMIVGGRGPSPERMTHRIAMEHGLPEIRGYYGMDFRDGEFIRENNATDGPPDSWDPPGAGKDGGEL